MQPWQIKIVYKTELVGFLQPMQGTFILAAFVWLPSLSLLVLMGAEFLGLDVSFLTFESMDVFLVDLICLDSLFEHLSMLRYPIRPAGPFFLLID